MIQKFLIEIENEKLKKSNDTFKNKDLIDFLEL